MKLRDKIFILKGLNQSKLERNCLRAGICFFFVVVVVVFVVVVVVVVGFGPGQLTSFMFILSYEAGFL